MNGSTWFAALLADPQFCGRLCLVLLHSLWQFALLAFVAKVANPWALRKSTELGYSLHVAALVVGLALLPITFARLAGNVSTGVLPVGGEVTISQLRITKPEPIAPAPVSVPPQTALQSPLPTPAQDSPPIPWWFALALWVMGGYVLGVGLMLVRLARGIWNSHRLAKSATPITTGPLAAALRSLANNWSLRVVPALAQAERIVVPQVVGLLRPTILLPTVALAGLTPDELAMILTHELAHVRRMDMWVNLAQRLAEAVLFFNPGLWYLSRRISTLREYCCDEATCRAASLAAPATRLRYAQALLHVMELSGKPSHSADLAALAATGSQPSELRRRVARLFGEPLREPVRVSRSGLLVLVAGVGLLLAGPVTWQVAAEPEQEAKPATSESQADTPYDHTSAKIASIEELRASYEAIYQRVNVLHKQGLQGGGLAEKQLALYHLLMVRAQLSEAKGDKEQALEHYEEVIKTAEGIVKSQKKRYEAGIITMDAVLEAIALRAKAKLAFYEAREIKDLSAKREEFFSRLKLQHADVRGLELSGLKLTFHTAGFQGADFTRAILKNADLDGGVAAFQGANFTGANLNSATLKGGSASFQGATFHHAKLNFAKLSGENAAFQKADFDGAVFRNGVLAGVEGALQVVNFDDADCSNTLFQIKGGTAFQSASLNNTRFAGADLSSIHPSALESCKFNPQTPPRYDAATKFPEGFDPQEHGWKLIE